MKKKILFSLLVFLSFSIVGMALSYTAPAEAQESPIVLKAVSFLPSHISSVHFLGVFAKRVKERSKGKLTINWVGGPEAIPRKKQGEALRTGVIDMVMFVSGEQIKYVPEGSAFLLSRVTPTQEREIGLYDFMRKLYEQSMNAYYLGRARSHGPFQIFLRAPIRKLEDLTGKQIGSSMAFKDQLLALGAAPLILTTPEMYSVMEKGVADGAISVMAVAARAGWPEVAKHFIDSAPYPANNGIFLINLKTWNRLPRNFQDLMISIEKEIEPEQWDYFLEDDKKARQKCIKAGAQPIVFSSADAEKYIHIFDQALWDKLKRECSPENYSKLRELLK